MSACCFYSFIPIFTFPHILLHISVYWTLFLRLLLFLVANFFPSALSILNKILIAFDNYYELSAHFEPESHSTSNRQLRQYCSTSSKIINICCFACNAIFCAFHALHSLSSNISFTNINLFSDNIVNVCRSLIYLCLLHRVFFMLHLNCVNTHNTSVESNLLSVFFVKENILIILNNSAKSLYSVE